MIRKELKPVPTLKQGDQVRLNMLDGKSLAYEVGEVTTTKFKMPRGRPSSGKTVVSIRLDPAVIAKFKATGDGWQARINDVLKAAKV